MNSIMTVRNNYLKSKGHKECPNPTQDGSFRGYSRIGGCQKRPPLSKLYHTYPSMMKLSEVVPYLKKIHNIYKSCDKPHEFL